MEILDNGTDCRGIEYTRVSLSPRMNDLSKKKIGQLQPLFPVLRPNNTKKEWLCKCDCGNIKVVSSSNLAQGYINSCGCKRSNTTSQHITEINNNRKQDLRGQQFGYLLVIDEDKKMTELHKQPRKKGHPGIHYYWKCKCLLCGMHEDSVRADVLTSGQRIMCQTCFGSLSQGEQKIKDLLIQNNISFIQQKSFPDCRLPSGYCARFDFYVDDKYIIEFDGYQHFKKDSYLFFDYEKTTVSDKLKNKWCFDNHIPIIRIPYYHLAKMTIQDLLLETSQFILKEEKYA